MAISKEQIYEMLDRQVDSLLENEQDRIANSANFSALVFDNLDDINWCGFYFLHGEELVLGPFQGKPACVRIPMGKGVCGTAAALCETQVVKNVHEFAGHIACDSASNSEIVIPLVKEGQLIGVLDIDSPDYSRFDDTDRSGIEQMVETFIKQTEF